jgi:phytoene/squalene synthetase
MSLNARPGPIALLRGLTMKRRQPDLAALGAEQDPERFLWSILPHAARSFAASIVVLPAEEARAAAVAYLYCRMLDTYEDLWPDPDTVDAELRRFAERFQGPEPMPAPVPIPEAPARDDRERVHLILIERCALVDRVFATLPGDIRRRIAALVGEMSEGMRWSCEVFSRQGGVLRDEAQLTRYCRNVIGHPAVFIVELVGRGEVPEQAREDAYLASEMIQLANVTRDIEADLARGVAYHPALEPYLGVVGESGDSTQAVLEVRREYLRLALSRVGSYRRLVQGLDLGSRAGVRIAAVLMIGFTDLHYRGCASESGLAPWSGPRGRIGVVARSLPALASPRWTARTLAAVERDFLAAARALELQCPREEPTPRVAECPHPPQSRPRPSHTATDPPRPNLRPGRPPAVPT